uniref:Transcription factor 20 n=1 Tax=Sander lucioperca TaxID=283035 RepID=A0A8D0A585_SANLU
MQNFSNSPVPPSLPPGFSGRAVGGTPYPPQPADPQISPRMTDDYAGMQQQSLHRSHHHPSQASHMLAYSARNRGAVEAPPTQNIHSGNTNNPYRKDAMDYYFSMGGKDRHRRGGMAYGAGFGYPNIDGHIPHQYRHAGSGSAPASGLMSPYPVDYGPSAGSGGGGGAGAGAFSPSHQYNMSQNAAMQSVPGSQMQHRQHGQTFPAVHHGQQHRSYPHSGHRMTPQYPHYSPQGGASTGSSGMYSPPPQRYLDGAASTGFDPKVNSSPSVNSSSNSVSSSVAANNVGPMENVQQSYHASNYPGYSQQTLSLHKQATLQHRNSQHNLGVGYDNSLKMQHQGPSPGSVYAKHHQASNPSTPLAASQEITKSPMHPNAQQTQINQNFSPISNPSPAASAVHSPSCSSSPSPLMGVSDVHGNPSGHGLSHPPTSNPRSSHGQGRLLQTMPQLSPTPNSNSSISSCGSSGNKMQDAGLNSLNALSSQVANLPNTVQHMLLTDSVLSQKKGKDVGQMQQTTHGVSPSQPRSRNASAASSTSTVKDGSALGIGDGASLDAGADEDSSLMSVCGSSGTKVEREEPFSEGEHGRVRQMSGASSGSELTGYHAACQSQTQTGQALAVKAVPSDSPSKERNVSETKANEAQIPSSSPSFGCQSSETGPTSHSAPPVSSSPSSTPSSIPPPQPNCVSESGLTHNDHRGGHRRTTEIKNEVIKNESEGTVDQTEKGSSQTQRDGEVNSQNCQDKENRLHTASRLHNNEREEKHTSEEQQSASSVGVIVSARSEGSHTEKSKHPQDNCIEEKHSLRESSSHNGEEGVDLSLYSSLHQKSNFGRPQNPPQSGPHKYGYPESTYGSDLSLKNRGRAGPAGVMDSNSRYLGYQQSQAGYGPVHPKYAGSVAEALVKRGQAAGAKGHEDNSQQFPSLLQEVLQGYNLDRRYGRPEQAFPAHLQVQQPFQTRHPYGITERKVLSNSQKSSGSILAPSERRSVICDVSPNRRSTPERDRESDREREREKSQSGASVIQQPFSSPAAANDLSKKDIAEKHVVKMETASRDAGPDAANLHTDHHGSGGANEADMEYHSKSVHSSVVMNADPYRRGNVDITPLPSHPLSTNPLSSPSRHQSYIHGVDLSTGSGGGFPGYRFGDTREGNMMPRSNPHFPSHHPYHNLSPQTQATNKLQMYPHSRGPPHHPHDMNDWVKAMNRPSKEMMMQPGSSPGRHKVSQSEQRQRMISQTDMPGEQLATKMSLHHQGAFFDLKMWESTHSGREGSTMIGDSFYRTQPPPPAPVASHVPVPPQCQNAAEPEVSRGAAKEARLPCPPPPPSSTKPSADMNSSQPQQVQRQTKAGGSGDTNPLILRRRVRSFISPIPAKRQLQAATNSHHSPGAQSESSHHNEDDSSSSDIPCPRLSSPLPGENTYLQPLSPSSGNTKALPPRKGRGLKLEAIVQKITPNIKKPAGHVDDEVAGGDDSYMDESHSLNDMIPFRGVDETGRGEQSAANLLRQKLQESGMGFDDYPGSDYYGATPPHHSQGHMLNRQHQMSSGRSSLSPQDSKLSESSVPKGYFPSGKKKGRPVGSVNKQKRAQNQAQTQGQGQPQAQAQSTTQSAPPAPTTPTTTAATTPPLVQTTSSSPPPAAPPLTDNKNTPPLTPPILTQIVKVDAESEDTPPEVEVKPVRRRRKGVKDEDETLQARGRQRRRRRGAAPTAPPVAKDDPDTPLGAGGSPGTNRVSIDPNRKGPFVPHIHVENKVPEIGAVCTIVNAGGSGIDSLLTSALSSQLSRRDRDSEKGETDEVETTLQSGKALPSSDYVVSGPVITETNHSGRLLCCLCQKWANYKHLGDLYGPFYPAEYAAKLPKNQPQVRQCPVTTGTNKTGPNLDMSSNALSTIQDTQTQDALFTKPPTESDYAISLDSNPIPLTMTARTSPTAGREEMMMHMTGKFSNSASSSSSSSFSSYTSKTTSLTLDMNLDIRPIPELKREPDLEIDQRQPHIQQQLQPPIEEAQQRPQHRKLTSHPRFKRRHKSSDDSPRMVPSNSKASLPFQPPPPALDSLGPLAQLAQLPQMPMDPEELWVHEGCIVWTSGVYLVNGRLYGLQEALDGARETVTLCGNICSVLIFSVPLTDCSLNEDNFSLRCPKHKVKKERLVFVLCDSVKILFFICHTSPLILSKLAKNDVQIALLKKTRRFEYLLLSIMSIRGQTNTTRDNSGIRLYLF